METISAKTAVKKIAQEYKALQTKVLDNACYNYYMKSHIPIKYYWKALSNFWDIAYKVGMHRNAKRKKQKKIVKQIKKLQTKRLNNGTT